MNHNNVIWTLSHPDDLWPMNHVIRVTLLALVSHPDELQQIHCVIPMTYPSILCHPDDLTEVGISPGRITAMLFCHPDEIRFLSYFIQMRWKIWIFHNTRWSFSNSVQHHSGSTIRSNTDPGARWVQLKLRFYRQTTKASSLFLFQI